VPCLICGKNPALTKMRQHVGGHILLSLREIEEPTRLKNKEFLVNLVRVGLDPCGFYGLDGCITRKVNPPRNFSSRVTSHYSHALGTAASNSSPCTNVPLHCLLC
ncbi:hypothetical protein B0H13DRAFT_1447281, partial [Mycena leptocephala]